MKKIFCLFLIFLFLTSTRLNSYAGTVTNPSIYELREIQSYTYDTNDTEKIARAIINTLQDNGFILQNIEPDLGFIHAKKEVKLKRTLKSRVAMYTFMEMLYGTWFGFSCCLDPSAALGLYETSIQLKNELAPHTVIFDSNISIIPFNNKTKVRFTFVEKVLENGDGYTTVKSSPRQVRRYYEPEIYREFFEQVDKNLFFETSL